MFRYLSAGRQASIFYHFNNCSGIWVRACKARTAYTVLSDLSEARAKVQRGATERSKFSN